MDVTIVDVSAAAAPRRAPRRMKDWGRVFEDMRARDLQRAEELASRLRQARSGIPYQEPTWLNRPPHLALRVILNGKELGRAGVSDPGSLGVSVVVRRRPDKQSLYMDAHGGDHVGPRTWRWRKWPWSPRRLEIGDRVRIEVVASARLSRSHVGEPETTEPTDVPQIARALSDIRKRLRSNWYRATTTDMLQAEKERSPPRRYSRR